MKYVIEHDVLTTLLDYDRETGLFTYKIRLGCKAAGTIAGSYDKDGYIIIQLCGEKYKAHRLAWFYVYGRWPVEIDHKDGSTDFNALDNLRECTRSENIANSLREVGESGFRGVKWDERSSSWRARISFGNCRKYLGPFDTKEEAYAAYLKAADIRHGDFALHNRPQSLKEI